MKKLNYNNLYYFHIIALEGSMASAAEKLKLSVSTLSEHLKNLEDSLSIQLFERKKARLKLNQYGNTVFKYTKIIFNAGEQLLDSLSCVTEENGFKVNIGISTNVSKVFPSTGFVKLFSSYNPFIKIRHHERDELIEGLVSQEFDIIITDAIYEVPNQTGFTTNIIKKVPLFLISSSTSEEYIQAFPSDFSKVPFINYAAHSSFSWYTERYFFDKKIYPNIVGEVDDVYIMKSFVSHGLGVAVLPETLVSFELQKGIFRLLDTLHTMNGKIYVTYNTLPTRDVLTALSLLKNSW
jgi:LysR family transcriptional regulator, transcriptional activator of nhaA